MRWEGSTAKDAGAPGLTWDQLREMVESGLCTVGNHTHTHVPPEWLDDRGARPLHRRARSAARRHATSLRLPLGRPRAVDGAGAARSGSAAPPPVRLGRNLPGNDPMRLRRGAGAPHRPASSSSRRSSAAGWHRSGSTAAWSRRRRGRVFVLDIGAVGAASPAQATRRSPDPGGPPDHRRHEPGAAARHRARIRRAVRTGDHRDVALQARTWSGSRRSGVRHVPLPGADPVVGPAAGRGCDA